MRDGSKYNSVMQLFNLTLLQVASVLSNININLSQKKKASNDNNNKCQLMIDITINNNNPQFHCLGPVCFCKKTTEPIRL